MSLYIIFPGHHVSGAARGEKKMARACKRERGNKTKEAGEMAQQLRASTALPEDAGSIPSTHLMFPNCLSITPTQGM